MSYSNELPVAIDRGFYFSNFFNFKNFYTVIHDNLMINWITMASVALCSMDLAISREEGEMITNPFSIWEEISIGVPHRSELGLL